MSNSPPIRIGVLSLESELWSAGGSYTRTLALALQSVSQARNTSVWMIADEGFQPPAGVASAILPKADPSLHGKLVRRSLQWKERFFPELSLSQGLRARARWVDRSDPRDLAATMGLDVLLPYLLPRKPYATRAIGWIPDFQHRVLPEFFSAAELDQRDRHYQAIASVSDRVMVSSDAVREDYCHFLPSLSAKAAVVRFPSLFAFTPPLTAVSHSTLERYRIPEKFALVANQFWRHKNHEYVISALAHLKARGTRVPTVMVGKPVDPRDPSNRTLSSLLQSISRAGLRDQVIVLGEVSFGELVDLLRSAAVVIQPSLCEGWNTTAEDAKALGRDLICSDIAVLREQVPESLGHFDPRDPESLSQILGRRWEALHAGPDPDRERLALSRAAESAVLFAHSLTDLCQLAAQDRPTKTPSRNPSAP